MTARRTTRPSRSSASRPASRSPRPSSITTSTCSSERADPAGDDASRLRASSRRATGPRSSASSSIVACCPATDPILHEMLTTIFDGARDDIERGIRPGMIDLGRRGGPLRRVIVAKGLARLTPEHVRWSSAPDLRTCWTHYDDPDEGLPVWRRHRLLSDDRRRGRREEPTIDGRYHDPRPRPRVARHPATP